MWVIKNMKQKYAFFNLIKLTCRLINKYILKIHFFFFYIVAKSNRGPNIGNGIVNWINYNMQENQVQGDKSISIHPADDYLTKTAHKAVLQIHHGKSRTLLLTCTRSWNLHEVPWNVSSRCHDLILRCKNTDVVKHDVFFVATDRRPRQFCSVDLFTLIFSSEQRCLPFDKVTDYRTLQHKMFVCFFGAWTKRSETRNETVSACEAKKKIINWFFGAWCDV